MRHLIGILLAIILSAALYAAGWGVIRVTALATHGRVMTGPTGMAALGALAGTGLLLGIFLAVRAVSPLATGLPGIGLLAWSATLAVQAHRALHWVPLQQTAYGAGFRALLVSGLLALLGAAMIVPLFMPSRWHTRREEEAEESVMPAPTGLLS